MVTFQHQEKNQFKHWLHLLLHQQMMKYVHYLVQYMSRQSIQIHLQLNKEILVVQVIKWSHR